MQKKSHRQNMNIKLFKNVMKIDKTNFYISKKYFPPKKFRLGV